MMQNALPVTGRPTNPLLDRFRAGWPNPDKVALAVPGGRSWSFSQLDADAARFANVLAGLGVVPGDRVAVQAEKSPAYIVVYLACLKAGAAFLPLNTAYTHTEIAYFIEDAAPKIFICDPARTDEFDLSRTTTLTMDAEGAGSLAGQAADVPAEFDPVTRAGDDIAAILYTSGTTGRSKGAMLTYDNLASNAATLMDYWRFSDRDVLIHALPVFHAHGLFVATNVALMAGSRMLYLSRFDPEEVLTLMSQATAFMGVPTLYTRLLRQARLDRNLAGSMRLFVSGSAPLLAETHREWSERTGHAILERYGMTETVMNTSNPYDGERRPGTVGFPLPGIELRIVDPDSGNPVPAGEIGMIEVRGPNVFKGYWQMPEKTKAEFRPDGYFITGDLGCIDADGYVTIVGRTKDLIISGGYNIYPREIEEVIDSLPGVAESAVVGVPHPDFGEGTVAIVVPRDGHTVDPARISRQLLDRLAKYKHPKVVVVEPELPRNTMGKVQKAALRERFGKQFIS